MISCVCPTRQVRRGFLETAVACFLSQTFTDSELIILDEGYEPHPQGDRATEVSRKLRARVYRDSLHPDSGQG